MQDKTNVEINVNNLIMNARIKQEKNNVDLQKENIKTINELLDQLDEINELYQDVTSSIQSENEKTAKICQKALEIQRKSKQNAQSNI